MPPKKVPAPIPEYDYDENLSVSVKTKAVNQNPDLCHYFGVLLHDDKVIDQHHKYCALSLQSHIVKRYKNTTSSGNLRTHLTDKHKVSLEHKLLEKNQRKVTDMLLTVGKDDSVVTGSSNDRFTLARQLCLWFCRDLLPFNTASKDGLHDFSVYAGIIKSNQKLPDRTTISDTALNDVYFTLKTYTKNFVKSNIPKTITPMDFWSDNVKRISYINYWIYWISDAWEMQKMCLGLKRFPHPHTAQLLADGFSTIRDEFELNGKTFLAVTDSGSNVKLSCQLLGLERESCQCHNLHLLVATDLIKNHSGVEPVRKLIKKMKDIKKALIFKYEDLKKLHDDEYNKRLYHLISSLQNISEVFECTEVLLTEFDEEDEDNQLLVDFCNNQIRTDSTFTTIKNSNAPVAIAS